MRKTGPHLHILIAAFLFMGIAAKAQMPTYHIEVFNEEDGIQSAKIIDMVRGDDGFLWLLYTNRVVRFDGRRVKEFLFDDRLVSIEKDKTNRIWANSMSHLYLFKDDLSGFHPVKVDTTAHPQLISMIGLPGCRQRLLTDHGFYCYDTGEKKFLPSDTLKSRINDGEFIFTHSYGLAGNTFFYASNDSIVSLNLKTGKKKSLYVYDLYRFYAIDEYSLIVSSWKGQTYVYDFSTSEIVRLKNPNAPKRRKKTFMGVVGFCKLEGDYGLLASYNNLITKYNPSNKSLRNINLFFKGQPYSYFKTMAIHRDDGKNIWIATNTDLLLFKPEEQGIGLFRNWEKDPENSFSEQVRNFAPDENGNLWLATLNGFAHFNLKTGKVKTFLATPGAKDRLNHPSIRGIVDDGRYLIIGQSNRGVWLYNPETSTYKRPPKTPIAETDDFIDLIYTLQNGDHVVIAREEVYLMDGETYLIKAIDYPGEDQNPVFCFQDEQGRVWVGAGHKLYSFNEKMEFQFASQALENPPYTMYQTGKGEYFVAGKGLSHFILKGKKLEVIKKVPFFEGMLISILYKDTKGKLWMGTENGIYSYEPNSGKIEPYGYYDNVQSGRFYINSFYRFPNGPLFIGGISGINYFYPEKLKTHEDSLIVSILRVSVNGKPADSYPKLPNLELGHTQKNIEITFSAPYFDNPTRVEYRYKLKGLSEKWIEVKNNNSLRFASLAPGNYNFTVAASINGRDWFETNSPLRFSITPPFWQTWWFIGLLILLGIGLLYLWIRNLRRRIRAEEMTTRFATSLFSQNTVEKTFWDVAKNCISILGLEDCVVYQYDKEKNKLVQKAAAGPKGNPKSQIVFNTIEIPMGKGIVGSAAKSQKTQIVNDLRKDPRYIVDDKKRLSEIAVPILVDGKTFGVIDSEHSKKNYFTRWHSKLLNKIANLCSEKISRYLLAEEVRVKIAQDLHDDMGSTLTSINIISNIAMGQVDTSKDIPDHLRKIKSNSEKMMESLDDIIWAINPAHDTLDQIGLHMKEYTAELLDSTDIEYTFDLGSEIERTKFELSKRKDLFLIFKEALNNALKYSSAKNIDIALKKKNRDILLSVQDNGSGFDPDTTTKGNGLGNMKNRAENIGGSFQIDSKKGKGTHICIKIPIT